MDKTVRIINFVVQNIESNRILTKEAPREDY